MNGNSALFTFVAVVWLMTLGRSILIMLFGKNICKKASKGEKTFLYPIINLFTMLEIADVSTFWGILLFVPILNMIVLVMMSYKLGKVFNTGMGFRIGLVIMPILFYPILSFSNKQYKVNDEAFFKQMESAKSESINLMTDAELAALAGDDDKEDNVEVDSIFKSNVQMMEKVEPYKAAKIDILGMEKLKSDPSGDPTMKEFGATKEEAKPEEKKDNIETVDL